MLDTPHKATGQISTFWYEYKLTEYTLNEKRTYTAETVAMVDCQQIHSKNIFGSYFARVRKKNFQRGGEWTCMREIE